MRAYYMKKLKIKKKNYKNEYDGLRWHSTFLPEVIIYFIQKGLKDF